tara:strand:- start:316 stop:465 length:150 start_codon:yes stop_codon:yes gene_type:complete
LLLLLLLLSYPNIAAAALQGSASALTLTTIKQNVKSGVYLCTIHSPLIP